jgi:hypothetical protein
VGTLLVIFLVATSLLSLSLPFDTLRQANEMKIIFLVDSMENILSLSSSIYMVDYPFGLVSWLNVGLYFYR